MVRPQATRLQQGSYRRSGFLTAYLPYGTIQRRLTFWAGIPLLTMFVLIVILDKIVMPDVTRHGEEFALPDFTNQKLFEVQVALNELGLTGAVKSQEYSPGQEEGVIMQQFPMSGTMVKPGREIRFVVSLGKKLVPIPDVHGLSVRQAMLDLETQGLVLGEIAWAFSDTIPERVVVFSYPSTGTEVPLGSAVNLMVNRGRASTFTYMPKVIGLPLSEAAKQLEAKSLKLGVVTYRTDENYLPETVLEQSEPEGAELEVGTEIDLVVSST